MNWQNVTENFTEDERHYRDTYLEISEIYGDTIECSLFSRVDGPYEICVSFGIMYGISYADADRAEKIREEMKQEIAAEYQKNNEPSDAFINYFANKYKLQIEDSLFNESDIMEALFNIMDSDTGPF